MKLPYKSWLTAWNFFEKHFLEKRVSFEYQRGNREKVLEIAFKKQHFCHLCGISYTRGAKRFVDDLKRHKVVEKAVIFSEDKNKILQKQFCLDQIDLLLTDKIRVCERGNFVNLQFDYGLRTNREIFAMTCLYTENGYSVPNSLINLRSNKGRSKSFRKSYSVTSIYYIDKNTREKHRII